MARHYKILSKQVFEAGQFSIVPIRYEDRLDIMKWRNEQMFHLRQSSSLSIEDQESYFNNVISNLFHHDAPDQLLFSYMERGRCIGYGGLVHINWIDKNAEISFLLDTHRNPDLLESDWDNYLNLIEQVAFSELKLHKLFTYAFDIRPYLYPIFEKSNYFLDARLKEHALFEGKYIDVVIHAKINEI